MISGDLCARLQFGFCLIFLFLAQASFCNCWRGPGLPTGHNRRINCATEKGIFVCSFQIVVPLIKPILPRQRAICFSGKAMKNGCPEAGCMYMYCQKTLSSSLRLLRIPPAICLPSQSTPSSQSYLPLPRLIFSFVNNKLSSICSPLRGRLLLTTNSWIPLAASLLLVIRKREKWLVKAFAITKIEHVRHKSINMQLKRRRTS